MSETSSTPGRTPRPSADDAAAPAAQRPLLTRRRAVAGGTLGVLGAAVLSACSSDSQSKAGASASASASAGTASSSAAAFEPAVQVQPARQATEVNPVKPITVRTDSGTLTTVRVTGGSKAVTGALSSDRKTWTSSTTLDFNTEYTVSWTAAAGDGRTKTGTSAFTTVTPAQQADAVLNVKDGTTYGTGQVIQFQFSEPVTNKKAVEKTITVTGGGRQAGKFRWYSDTLLRYRPSDKWAPNSSVTLTAKLLGVDFGDGQIGNKDYRLTFRTGPTHYAYVDNNTKTMTIYENGKKTKVFPVTLGDTEWPSVTGQLVIMEKAKKYYFDASTLGLKRGDAHWYEPFYATNTNRLTASGAFVHQAEPSAYAYVGVSNISHGCIGLLPDGAEYFYDTFRVGDVVETVNTDYGQADPDNGYGDWNIPYARYSDTTYHGNW